MLESIIRKYRRIARQRPRDANAHANLAWALEWIKAYSDAIAACRKALSLKPEHVGAYYTLGMALRAVGDREGAVAAFREVVRLKSLQECKNPTGSIQETVDGNDLAMAHYTLAEALWRNGDIDGAIAALREALRVQPDCAKALAALGMALRYQGDHQGAVIAYKGLVRLWPAVATAHYKLGVTLRHIGDGEGADAAFREWSRLKPDLRPPPAIGLVCDACGAQDLEHYYTSKRGDATLCPGCFQGRVERGQAREAET